MRRHFLCTVSAMAVGILAGAPSWAADMPARSAPRRVAVAPPVFAPNWQGFYLGAHAGAAWSSHSYSGTDASHIGSGNLRGLALGLHAGYNWQFNQWLLGIEADGTLTPAEKNSGNPNSDTSLRRRTDWLASIRGRLGMTFDRTLIYATGGVAWVSGNSVLASTGSHSAQSYVATGGVVGGGIEWKYNPQVSLRVEALHYMFNNNINHPMHAGGIDRLDNMTVVRGGVSWHLMPQ